MDDSNYSRMDVGRDDVIERHEENLVALDKKIDRNYDLNEAGHGKIEGILTDIRLSIENVRGDIRGSKMVAAVVWSLFLIFMGALGWVADRAAYTVQETAEQLDALDRRTAVDWANGRKWGEKLDRDIERLDEEVREMRKQKDRNQR